MRSTPAPCVRSRRSNGKLFVALAREVCRTATAWVKCLALQLDLELTRCPGLSAESEPVGAEEGSGVSLALIGYRETMKTYVALLRGINVGGKGLLQMKELVAILESLGCLTVRTYIQSGNAVFEHKESEAGKLAGKISAAIEKKRGFAPHVLVLDAKELKRAVDGNPFPEGAAEPKSLHLFFLDSKPAKSTLKSLDALKSATERFELLGNWFYLHAPDGIGRSKLAASVERHLKVPVTSRNWRTVCTLLEIANGHE